MWNQTKELGKNPLLLIHAFFFLLFFSVPALNHFYLRLPALDFGIANQAMFSYAGFNDYPSTLILQREQMPYLSLHFSLWVPILSLFSYVFGSYTLLLFQSLALVFAGFYLVKIAKHLQINNSILPVLLIQFYSIWAIFAAISDGFHDNTLAACFVPALFLGFLKADKKLIITAFVGILISKENMAIWMPALLVSFLLSSNQIQKLWKFIGLLLLVDFVYFLLVTQLIMPALNPTGKFEQIERFSHLGKSFKEIIFYIIQHPLDMFKMMFFSHIQPDEMENIKHEFWFVLLASGFVAVLFKPSLLIAFLPLLFQKLWNKEVVFWGINYHYGIEMAPLLSIAIIIMIGKFQSTKIKWVLASLFLFFTGYTTYSKMQIRKSVWYDDKKENIFSQKHYTSSINFNQIKANLNYIQADDMVSTNSGLVPHLANRKSVFLFPRIEKNCKVLLLKDCLDVYPLTQDEYKKEIAALNNAAISKSLYNGLKIEKLAEDEFSYLFKILN